MGPDLLKLMKKVFLTQLKENLKVLKKNKSSTVFTIAKTSKEETEPYLTPIRECDFFVVCGCVIFEQSIICLLYTSPSPRD